MSQETTQKEITITKVAQVRTFTCDICGKGVDTPADNDFALRGASVVGFGDISQWYSVNQRATRDTNVCSAECLSQLAVNLISAKG